MSSEDGDALEVNGSSANGSRNKRARTSTRASSDSESSALVAAPASPQPTAMRNMLTSAEKMQQYCKDLSEKKPIPLSFRVSSKPFLLIYRMILLLLCCC
jgi:hypothetical protein